MIEVKAKMEAGLAELECPAVKELSKTVCAPCGFTVIVHCPSCGIQITGCICTSVERNGYTAAVAQFGQERVDRAIKRQKDAEGLAKEQAVRSGLWVPGMN